MDYAGSYISNVNITIPEGYKIEGVEALNMNVDNETGSFISTAVLEGNVLKLKTSKVYKANYFEKSKWPLMVEFLDAAFDFTQKKVVLKAE